MNTKFMTCIGIAVFKIDFLSVFLFQYVRKCTHLNVLHDISNSAMQVLL